MKFQQLHHLEQLLELGVSSSSNSSSNSSSSSSSNSSSNNTNLLPRPQTLMEALSFAQIQTQYLI
jgi:hypothetical protein